MFAYDTVSSETAAICGSVLSTAGGAKLTFIAGGPAEGTRLAMAVFGRVCAGVCGVFYR